MEERNFNSTSPFYTLDAFNGDLAEQLILAIESFETDDGEAWRNLLLTDRFLHQRLTAQGISNPENRSTITWDWATILFTTCVVLAPDQGTIPIGEAMTRERFGRFPHGNGSALEYFLEYIRPHRAITDNDGQSLFDDLCKGIKHLTSRCGEAVQGHHGFSQGFGGLQLLGFLTATEVTQLRQCLASQAWTVAFDEPLDGGVADVANHLSSLLKAAERRRVGLVLRAHQ